MSSYRFCPICDKMETVLLCEDKATTTINNTSVDFMEVHYKCPTTGEFFYDHQLFNQNILRARNVYTELKGTA